MVTNALGIYEKALPRGLSWEQTFDLVHELGYNFLEFSVDESDERLARLDWTEHDRARFRDAMWHTHSRINTMMLSGHRRFPLGSKDPEVREKALDMMRKAIDLAVDLGIRNIQLAGIYWFPEHGGFISTYMKQVAEYIHSKNLDYRWIPYYGAFGHADWKKYGFDYAYYQPNYCFSTTIPRQRLYDACAEALSADMGLEVEFDSNYAFERNVAYIDVYEELGILEKSNLAYYGGTSFEYWKNGITEERAFYERLAKIIAERQKKFTTNKKTPDTL